MNKIIKHKELLQQWEELSQQLSNSLEDLMEDNSLTIDKRFKLLSEAPTVIGYNVYATNDLTLEIDDDTDIDLDQLQCVYNDKYNVSDLIDLILFDSNLNQEDRTELIQKFKEFCVRNCYTLVVC